MNKTDLLFQMMEQPHRYTADQWQEILADDECRELYTLMSKTQGAVNAARADESITDEMIDEEWQRLEPARSNQWFSVFYKFAAMFVGILMLSGIAFATILIVRQYQEQETPQMADTIAEPSSQRPTLNVQIEETDTIIAQPRIFDNVPLDTMLYEMADYYHVTVEFQKEACRHLRMHFVWKHCESLGQVVERLNSFEAVNIICEPDKLIVK